MTPKVTAALEAKKNIKLPHNYYPDDNLKNTPLNKWRPFANAEIDTLFSQNFNFLTILPLEEPKYQIIKSNKNYEIRKYKDRLAVEVEYSNDLIKEFAKKSDIAVITIGRNSGETADRAEKDDFLLSKKESQMIKNACEVFHSYGKKVLVVLNIGGVIETASWSDLPDAILVAWQAGQESGNSVVDIISGIVNPSGKLPMTFPVNLSDHGSSENFPTGVKATMADFLMASIIGSSEESLRSNKPKILIIPFMKKEFMLDIDISIKEKQMFRILLDSDFLILILIIVI